MSFFTDISSTFLEITDTVCEYIPALPPNARRRLLAFLLLERAFRKTPLPPGRQLPVTILRQFKKEVALVTGYMVLIAHDDAVDQYNLQASQIYEQLSRCLAAFLMNVFPSEATPTVGALRETMKECFDRMQDTLASDPRILEDLPHFLPHSSLLAGLADDEPLSIQNLLIQDHYEPVCRDWLNMSIVGAMGMGRAVGNIFRWMKEHLAQDDAVLQRRYEYLVGIIVRCMYAQAKSPEQKNLETLSYARHVELAYLKSTILLDIRNYVSNLVNEERFFVSRHHAARICEQIVDDLQDIDEDTQDEVLNLLHMHIVEQGRLAEKFLALPAKQAISLSTIEELLQDTVILRGTYDRSFLYRNPYIAADRDEEGNLQIEPAEVEKILREVWVNARDELDWSTETLARHRLALYEALKVAWREHDHEAVLDVIYRSRFPFALLLALERFLHQNKSVIIHHYAQYGARVTGHISYYLSGLGLKYLWLGLWKQRLFQSKSFSARAIPSGGSHGYPSRT